jgi:cell division protein FtsB
MVQNYVRQLETKEDVIRNLKARFDDAHQDRAVEALSRRENDAIKQENRMLRDKISELSRDLDLA